MSNNVTTKQGGGIGVIRLTAFAIGSTLASGVFSLSGDMAANGAGTAAVLVGWAICGIGMLALAMSFYNLNRIRPDLTSGIYSYAKEGFGDYIGFNSAWGYWISALLANVSFATLLFAALGYFFPVFGEGNNLPSILLASVFLWGTVALVLRGVNEATTINLVVVIAKLMPILVLIVAILFAKAFDPAIFLSNFWGESTGLSFMEQIQATTYTTVWVFVGIEGAVVISGRARTTKDAGKATVISFISLLAIYGMISILSMGVMTNTELAALGNPPMAGVLEHVVGPWGAALVNLAVVISLGGATFTYTILSAEAAYAPAIKGSFSKIFTKENKRKAPIGSLIITNVVIQIFLFIVYFNESTYQIFYTLSASMIMVPYFLSAGYYLKLTMKGVGLEGKSGVQTAASWIFSILGTIYGGWLLYSSGLTYILITALLYAPGTLIYIWSKREQGQKAFEKPVDLGVLVAILIMFVASAVLIGNGTIQPF